MQEILDTIFDPDKPYHAGGKIESYFYTAFQVLWPELLARVQKLYVDNPTYDIWITGHSLGGAMASIASTEAVYTGVASAQKVMAIVHYR